MARSRYKIKISYSDKYTDNITHLNVTAESKTKALIRALKHEANVGTIEYVVDAKVERLHVVV